jgi:hypothetical protein
LKGFEQEFRNADSVGLVGDFEAIETPRHRANLRNEYRATGGKIRQALHDSVHPLYNHYATRF